MGPLVGVRQPKTARTKASSTSEYKAESVLPLDLTEDYVYMEWYDAAGISDLKNATAMGVFLRWTLADMTKKIVKE